jgi:membrane-bound metal-dependent hydrolase YbcI (DUF457 family)
MANFNTHLAVAAVGSGLCATVAFAGNVAPHNYLLTLTLAGTVGGILPDIDLEQTLPSRILFNALGVVTAFMVLFYFDRQYSIIELWIIWIATFLAVRYGVFTIVHERTKHRGIFHSLLAAAFFMVLTADIFARALKEPPALAWLAGLFMLIGYIIHLALDEIYSVDISGAELKKSFGTALKPIDLNSWSASALMGAAFAAAVWFAPSANGFNNMMRSPAITSLFKERLLPKGGWFHAPRFADTSPGPKHGETE